MAKYKPKYKNNEGQILDLDILAADSIKLNNQAADYYLDIEHNQEIDGQKDFNTVPRVKVGGESPREGLPTETYTQLQYVESDGSQYIDTTYTINTATDTVEIVFECVGTTIYKWLFGEHDNNARFGLGVGDGTNKRNVAYGASTYKINDTLFYNQLHYFKADTTGVFIDSTKIADYSNFSSTSSLALFCLNYGGFVNGTTARIQSYKHTRNNVALIDLVSVVRNSDDKAGFYDFVSENFIGSATSTELSAGPGLPGPHYETLLTDANLASVAFSGSYYDLSNTPTIPTVNNGTLTIQKNGSTVNTFTANASSNVTVNITVPTKDSDLTNDRYVRYDTNSQGLTTTQKSNARINIGAGTSDFSGSYNDLTNKPTIPTVNDSTITIKQNGISDQTFTLNGSTKTITLVDTTYDVATTTTAGLMSANDKTKLNNIVSGAEVNVQSDWNVNDSTSDAYIKNKPTIPTKTSDLNNDSNFVTLEDVEEDNSSKPIQSQIALFKNQNEQWGESLKTFELSELSNIDIVFKSTLVGSTKTNHYHAGNIRYCTIIGLFKDDNNYISLYNNGYKVSIKLKLNGSDVYNVDLGSSAVGTPYCYAASYGATLDLHNKVVKVKIINNNTLTDIYSYDFSSWDISSLTNLKIVTSLGDYVTGTELVYVKVNGITDFNNLLTQCLEYGNYQAFPTYLPIPYYNISINGVTCGGTLVESISNYHKIYDVNVGNTKNYISLGPTAPSSELGKSAPIIVRMKFKILSKSENMCWDYGIAVQSTKIYQGDTFIQKLGWNLPVFEPELNTEYILYRKMPQQSQHNLSTLVSYGLKGIGSFRIEILDCWTGLEQSSNLCAQSYDGVYFRGLQPFKGTNLLFTTDYSSINTSKTGTGVPKNFVYLDASSSKSYIYDGKEWKELPKSVNNAILTIQKNGTTIDTFTANSNTNKTINITVPTKTSDITNDSGFITSSSIPTKTSDLTNDSGFITSASLPTNHVTTDSTQTISGVKTFTSRVNFTGTGDANALYLTTNTRIDVYGTTQTVLGFASGTFLINHTNYNLNLRGKGDRPTYNDTKNFAFTSDIPTLATTSTANKILVSTSTSGTNKWSDSSVWSGNAGFLKVNSSGVTSVDTNNYQTVDTFLTAIINAPQTTLTNTDYVIGIQNDAVGLISGSVAIANPTGTPTSTLNKLKVGNTIYNTGIEIIDLT